MTVNQDVGGGGGGLRECGHDWADPHRNGWLLMLLYHSGGSKLGLGSQVDLGHNGPSVNAMGDMR